MTVTVTQTVTAAPEADGAGQEGGADSGVALPVICGSKPVVREGTAPSDAVGGYETRWTSTPADADGNELHPPDWPDELKQHPAVALINTWDDSLVEAVDRTGCRGLDTYTVVPDPAWPAQSIVIVDVDTGEVLESFAIDADGTALP